MLRPTLIPSLRRLIPRPRSAVKISAFAGLLGAGVLVAGSSALSATPSDDCLLPPVCPTLPAPTVPTIPTVSLPTPTTTSPSTTTTPSTTTSPSDSSPATSGGTGSVGGGAAQGAETSAAAPDAHAPLTYSVRTSVRRTGGRRWIDLRLTLSQPATLVAILHRSEVPFVATVRTGKAGSNAFALSVPRRVRAGRYALRLVLATSSARHTINRRISLPK
jgi:hypothetical protein